MQELNYKRPTYHEIFYGNIQEKKNPLLPFQSSYVWELIELIFHAFTELSITWAYLLRFTWRLPHLPGGNALKLMQSAGQSTTQQKLLCFVLWPSQLSPEDTEAQRRRGFV